MITVSTTSQAERILPVNSWLNIIRSCDCQVHATFLTVTSWCADSSSHWPENISTISSHAAPYQPVNEFPALVAIPKCSFTTFFHRIQPLETQSLGQTNSIHIFHLLPTRIPSICPVLYKYLNQNYVWILFFFIPVRSLIHIVCIYYRATTEIHFIYPIRKPTWTAC